MLMMWETCVCVRPSEYERVVIYLNNNIVFCQKNESLTVNVWFIS